MKNTLSFSSSKSDYVLPVSILMLYLLIFGVMSKELYLIKGNFHDLWMPYISAYAVKMGAVLHIDLHTPFGPIYAVINYISLLIIEKAPAHLGPSDMIFLSSLLFSVVTYGVYILFSKSAYKSSSSGLLLCLALSTVFQLRDLSGPLSLSRVLWYGSYNAHLWSILLIQIVSVLDFQANMRSHEGSSILKKINRKFIYFFALQFMCAFITLNYKFNFFIASLGIAASILFYLDMRLKALYLLAATALSVLFLLFVSYVFDYSYYAYFQDLAQVIKSKKSLPSKIFLAPPVFFLFVYILNLIRENSSRLDLEYFFKFRSNIVKDINQNTGLLNLKFLYFVFCIACAVFVTIAGDWQRPVLYYFLIFLFFVRYNFSSGSVNRVAKVFLLFFILLNYLSFFYMLTTSPKSNIKASKKISRYKSVQILDNKKDFFTKNYGGLDHLYSFFGKGKKNPDFFLQLSSTYKPRKRSLKLHFSNIEYDLMLADAKQQVASLVTSSLDDLLMLEFTNPLPLIFKTRIPKGSFHWLHAGTTFSFDQTNKLYELYKDAEVVYMPVVSSDGNEQTYFNCTFYDWNFKYKKFQVLNVSMFGITFVSEDKIDELGLKPFSYDLEQLKSNCQSLLNEPYLQD